MKNKFHFLVCLLAFHVSPAQNNYTPSVDTLAQHKLQQWQDLKFGL
jgi:hypothetical protein